MENIRLKIIHNERRDLYYQTYFKVTPEIFSTTWNRVRDPVENQVRDQTISQIKEEIKA
jgi:hypothetical protein